MTKDLPPLEDMTLRQLRRVASEYGVSRYSRMRKDQLLESILEIQRSRGLITTPVASPVPGPEPQTTVEAAKYDVGQVVMAPEALADVDEILDDLPSGYGESRIMLLPRDPQWAYAYWDIPNDHKDAVRRQGGQQLVLRLYDVTNINLATQAPHGLQEYPCDELAREWYLPIPVSDRDYIIDIGYRSADGRFLVLARSSRIHVPPVYPSDWVEDKFLTLSWDEDLRGKTFMELVPPTQKSVTAGLYDQMYAMTQEADSMRVAGSLYGSMQHVPASVPPGSAQMVESLSSYVFPSGMGMWAVPSMSGVGMAVEMGVPTMSGVGMTMSGAGMMGMAGMTMSGVGMNMSGAGMMGMAGMTMSGAGMNMSGVGMNMSGVGMNMSGVGFSASAPPVKSRKFWLVADAELIVYGATEPDATVTIAGRPVQLNSDGTFRFQMSFQDGLIDFPILAVAADGEQNRAIHMSFTRETPERRTNTKEEAVEELLV